MATENCPERITISQNRGTERKDSFLRRANGSSVGLTKTEAALLRYLHKHRGHVLAYRRFSPILRADCRADLGVRLLRQYMLTVRDKLRKSKAPYVLAVAYNVGYALCRVCVQAGVTVRNAGAPRSDHRPSRNTPDIAHTAPTITVLPYRTPIVPSGWGIVDLSPAEGPRVHAR